MAVIAHNEKEVELLARLIRAEAEADGNLAMLMVANVGVNRVLADCLDFRNIRTIQNGLPASRRFQIDARSYFYQAAGSKIRLAKGPQGEDSHPNLCPLVLQCGDADCSAQWFGHGTADAINRIAFMRRSKVKGVMPDIEAAYFNPVTHIYYRKKQKERSRLESFISRR